MSVAVFELKHPKCLLWSEGNPLQEITFYKSQFKDVNF